MAQRRISAPGVVRGVYFLLFDLPQFTQFREQVAQRLRAAGRDPSLFDPAALSPVLIAADLDGSFSRWLPLRADPASTALHRLSFSSVAAEPGSSSPGPSG